MSKPRSFQKNHSAAPSGQRKPNKQANAGGNARLNKHVEHAKGSMLPALGEELLEDLIAASPNPFLVILDCIQDPHNLGAILRSCDGANVTAVIAPKDKSCGLTETVQRIAVGAAENVPFVQVTNLARCMRELKQQGIWIVGTSDKADKSFWDIDYTGPIAIAMGAEGEGLRRLSEEECDFLISLPMHGSVPCLNVSVATGICLYEVLRQRRAAKS